MGYQTSEPEQNSVLKKLIPSKAKFEIKPPDDSMPPESYKWYVFTTLIAFGIGSIQFGFFVWCVTVFGLAVLP